MRLAEKAGAGDLKALHYLLALEKDEQPLAAEQLDAHASPERALEKVEAFLDRRRAALGPGLGGKQ